MLGRIRFKLAVALAFAILLMFIVYRSELNADSISPNSSPASQPTPKEFADFMKKAVQDQESQLYRFDRPGLLLPLMRVKESERDPEFRRRLAREWVRSKTLIIAGTARNAMNGLLSSLKNLRRLRSLFKNSWMLFVENDSTDSTRRHLQSLVKSDPTVVLLGCPATVANCTLKIKYTSNRTHISGSAMKRTFEEEVERGLMMSSLRNVYLSYAYTFLPDADLMLMIDPDLTWADWNIDSVLQGLYYFMAKPQLQQLCAHTTHKGELYDPCTLTFFINKQFGEDTKLPVVDYKTALGDADKDREPVKVSSCYQAFSFYRLPELAKRRLWYKRAKGEWMCEHNTLSRQLEEVYIDPQMKLNVMRTL